MGVKGQFRFTKQERIALPEDFRNVMRSGRKLVSENIILFVRKNKSPFHRLGIVVKKEVGPAVFRNRVKRYFREFFRLHKHLIKGSFDMVIMPKKGCSFRRYGEAEKELRGLLAI